jgi:uncharacterized BrkB/YihY/UPF0761 family membrane protein
MSTAAITMLAAVGAGLVLGLALTGRVHRTSLRLVGQSVVRAITLPVGVALLAVLATAALLSVIPSLPPDRPWPVLAGTGLLVTCLTVLAVPFTFYLVSRTARRDLEALGAGRRVARALGLAGAVASMALVMCAALTAVVLVNPSP